MTGRPPPVRRSAGMRGTPRNDPRGDDPVISSTPPRPRAAAPVPAPLEPSVPQRLSRHAKPKVLMGEVTAPRGQEIGQYREAFRAFMAARGLRPTQWAKDAGVPAGEILAYLTGRQRFFSPGVADALARSAGVGTDEMFR